ncbi:MAG: FtsX-like permease family protein, partial [Bacteroidota bacterium]
MDIGKLGQFTVTGVLKELPGKSHLHFEALASFSSIPSLEAQEKLGAILNDWSNTSAGWVYFRINEDQKHGLKTYLNQLADVHYTDESEYKVAFDIQPMTDITPGPLMGNQIGESLPNFFVIGLIILAILIMSCSAFNYANLSTARALTRFKEVGVRKVMGSTKGQLVTQFVVESVLVSLLSLILAVGILSLLIPAFESLSLSSLLSWELNPDTTVYLQFLAFSFITGLLVGFFPALYMSSVKVLGALKGLETPKMTKIGLRKSLIVIQLVISIILITSSALVYRQINYMISYDYGFNKDQVISIDLQGQSYDLLKPELAKMSFVSDVSGSNNVPNTGSHDDVKVRLNPSDEPLEFYYYAVDESYLSLMELELISGTNFKSGSSSVDQIIINETGLSSLAIEDPRGSVGTKVILEDSTEVVIAGVVKDYNFQMLYMPVEPMLLRFRPKEIDWVQVKIAGNDVLHELDEVEKVWAEFDPNHDIEYKFLDEQISDFYGVFYDIAYIVGLVSVLSILIAGLGLLGITSYSMKTRLKEVGIR